MDTLAEELRALLLNRRGLTGSEGDDPLPMIARCLVLLEAAWDQQREVTDRLDVRVGCLEGELARRTREGAAL